MNKGAKPTPIDHRDFSTKSFKKIRFGAAVAFPPEYNTDAGLSMPNQDVENDQFTPPVQAMYNGCTDYCDAEVATDLDGILKDPIAVENITHANALGGIDVRTALKAAVELGWITGFFNVEPEDGQDMFDAIRDAMVSGGTEKRSASVGTKWIEDPFELVGSDGIIAMPDFNNPSFTWHNWKICGWKTIGDQVYLVGKTWQGAAYGDKGFCYFSRPLVNNLFAISGSVAYTTTKGVLPPITSISTTWLQWLISYARNLLPY